MSDPWKKWMPGVLNSDQVKEIVKEEILMGIELEDDSSFDASSIDLHLSDEGYQIINGTVKPSKGERFTDLLKEEKFFKKLPKNLSYNLETNNSYIFKLKEYIDVNHPAFTDFFGEATARSTIGRLDVLVRLIVDGMDRYEGFAPKTMRDNKSNGEMFVEIIPSSFKITVRSSDPITQLRIFYKEPEYSLIKKNFDWLVEKSGNFLNSLYLSVNLQPDDKYNENISAFRARIDINEEIIINGNRKYEPKKFWEPVSSENERLLINRDRFYILRSIERMSLPRGVAVYCKAIDETLGEMRIHYAGFVHPQFGDRDDGIFGTPLIFEVRGHSRDVNLKHGEKLAKLVFYRMSSEGNGKKSYNDQELQLSSRFNKWL